MNPIKNFFAVWGLKLALGSLLAVSVFAGVQTFRLGGVQNALAEAKEDLQAAKDWQLEVIRAVAIAADNPDVDGKTAIAQIQQLGHTRVNLTNAIDDQNKAIVMMEQQSQDALAIAEKARKDRAAATRKADALAQELRNRSRVPAPAADMEAAVRRTQDELYEAGI